MCLFYIKPSICLYVNILNDKNDFYLIKIHNFSKIIKTLNLRRHIRNERMIGREQFKNNLHI